MIQLKNQILTPEIATQKPIVYDSYYLNNNTPKPVVVFCHGYKGFKDWGAWHLVAQTFANAGFYFLKFNFSHNGGTVKQPIDFPDLEAFAQNNYTKELDDVKRVLDHITSTKNQILIDTSNISLIGHSRGGGIVLIKAEEDPRVTNVVTWAGVSDYKVRFQEGTPQFEKFKKTGKYVVENGRTKQQMPHDWQFYTNFIENEDRLTIQRATEKLQKPYLIVHGDKDPTVTLEEAKKLHMWNPASFFFTIEGADHVFGASHPYDSTKMPNHLAQVVSKTIAFLQDC